MGDLGKQTETYLITGGTGTLGTILTKRLLAEGHKVRIFARGEHEHQKLEASLPEDQRVRLTKCVGAVEELGRLRRAVDGVDVVIHAAAQKVVPLAETNPWSCIRTNVDGTINVAEACLDGGVKRAILVSSDKARSPSTLYGASKLCAERAWLASNSYRGGKGGLFAGCCYGNVFASTGSVIPFWIEEHSKGKPISITDPKMTRFHMTLDYACSFVLRVANTCQPKTMTIPKLPSYTLGDLAAAFMKVFAVTQKPVVTGRRPAEKVHEEMITETESSMILCENDLDYVLTPGIVQRDFYNFTPNDTHVAASYHSGTNPWRVPMSELEQLVGRFKA